MREAAIPIAMLAVFTAMAFTSTGCSTTKTVVERDTVIVKEKQGDSVSIDHKVNIKDSVRIKDSTVVHVNERGDVVKTETWHDREHISSISDSTQYYREQYAALLASYTRLREESQKTANAALTTKEKLHSEAKGIGIGIIVGLLIALALWFALRKMKPP